MEPEKFDYACPKSSSELKKLLHDAKKYVLYAGGTDVMVQLRHNLIQPSLLIDLKKMPGFGNIREKNGTVEIGATVTLHEISTSPIIKKHFPALAQGAGRVGSLQIRNRASLVGNLCNASPCADTVPGLLIHDAKIHIISSSGSRRVSIHNFFLGPRKSILKPGECVDYVILPIQEKCHSVYESFSRRRAVDLSTASVAVGCFADGTNKPALRIAVGACSAITCRALKSESWLKKHGLTEESIQKAAELLPLTPITDLRGSKEFRLHIARSLFIKAVNELKKGCELLKKYALK
jgi:carbon-monoxide dehydrogenase medium subunit